MQKFSSVAACVIQAMALIFLIAPLSACRTFGPDAIQSSQLDYNKALANGVQQELLLNIVRLRYRESPFFLNPGNLTTSFKTSASFGLSGDLDLGGGSDTVSPSTGFGYSHAPTVVYTPVQGKDFVRDLMTPLDPSELFFLDQSGWDIKRVFGLAIERINHLDNAPSASGPTPEQAPPGLGDFKTLIHLLSELQTEGSFGYSQSSRAGSVNIFLKTDSEDDPKVNEVKRLLELSHASTELRLHHEEQIQDQESISIGTRSLLGILFYLSHNVQAPESHRNQGWVTITRKDGDPFDWSDTPAGEYFKILFSQKPPENAFLSVPYKKGYYYIADEDLNTKSTFLLLLHLQSLQAGKNHEVNSPTLMIPVGG